MIPREFRLPAKTPLMSPINISLPFFQVKVAKNNVSHNRYAFVISKRVDKRAVVRNRLRRMLREMIFSHTKNTTQSLDMVVVVKKSFLDVSPTDLQQQVDQVVDKVQNL